MEIQATRESYPSNPVYRIILNHRTITYSLTRRNRKTIGLSVDASGLSIIAPLKLPQKEIENTLQHKADWIIEKLDACKDRKDSRPEWKLNTVYWLLGEPYQLIALSGQLQIRPQRSMNEEMIESLITESTLTTFSAQQIERYVLTWYRQQAIPCMVERLTLYAEKLGMTVPVFHLSNARTRWGSCNAAGVIRLNWRLIQLPLALIDYVVAHELAHLIEMNHSKAFWKVVAQIYPDYRLAQRELKQIGKLMI